jgi:hypothetical protein
MNSQTTYYFMKDLDSKNIVSLHQTCKRSIKPTQSTRAPKQAYKKAESKSFCHQVYQDRDMYILVRVNEHKSTKERQKQDLS